MEKIKPVPTLSRMGWVVDTHPKVDFLMAHWVRSDKRQNPLLTNKVHNLQWLLQRHQGDLVGLCEAINTDLNAYFSNYYTDVSVETSFENISPDGLGSDYHISIAISFTDGLARHSVSRILRTDGKHFKNFVIDNNVGIEASSI